MVRIGWGGAIAETLQTLFKVFGTFLAILKIENNMEKVSCDLLDSKRSQETFRRSPHFGIIGRNFLRTKLLGCSRPWLRTGITICLLHRLDLLGTYSFEIVVKY